LTETYLVSGPLSGSAAFIFIVAIIITVIVKCRKRRSKPKETSRPTTTAVTDARDSYLEGSLEIFEDDREYCTIPGAEDGHNNNACEYYSSAGPFEPDTNKQYSVLGEADTTPAANNSPYYLTLTSEYE